MVSWKDIIIIFRVRIPQLLLLEEQKSKMQIWLLIRPPSNSSPRQSRGRGPFEGNLFPLFAAVRMFSREPRSRSPNSTAYRIASTSASGVAPASRRFSNLWKQTFFNRLAGFLEPFVLNGVLGRICPLGELLLGHSKGNSSWN